MADVELLKLLPGGGTIVAFIIVVVLFLRHQERIDARVDTMTKLFSDNISTLTGKLVQISQDTTAALKGLAEAVRDLRERINAK
jgi:hypothetical protein